jgi:hypothetical protein
MDDATRQDLRRRKLCFSCQEPWVPGHRCAGKAKAHYIEVFSDSGEDEEDRENRVRRRIHRWQRQSRHRWESTRGL